MRDPARMLALAALLIAVAVAAQGGAATGGTDSAAAGPCRAAQTRTVLRSFFQLWNAGDLGAIDRLVAPKPHFRWVSAGPPGARIGPIAFHRASLRAYVARRHAKSDWLELMRFRFNGSDVREGHGFGHFEVDASRDADDWPGDFSHERTGKGAIICTLRRPMIAVLTLS